MKTRKFSTVPRLVWASQHRTADLKVRATGLLLLVLLVAFGAAQPIAAGQGQPPAVVPAPAQAAPVQMSPQSPSICGAQQLCYETSDFAVTITDFRVSGSGDKVIDTTLRFQNKTNQPLILAYVEGSAMALDDQGNRYGLNPYADRSGNAVRGIGRVPNNDPNVCCKFVLRPGGAGDTLFELWWRPNNTAGVNFELDLSVREITPLEGHQFALAGEFPLRFQGLANGAGGGFAQANASGPGLVAGAAPGVAGVGSAAGVASAVAGTASGASGQPGLRPGRTGCSERSLHDFQCGEFSWESKPEGGWRSLPDFECG